MADIADVENALAALVAGFVYPNGYALPSATGRPVYVLPGAPDARSVEEAKAAGATCVGVVAAAHLARPRWS